MLRCMKCGRKETSLFESLYGEERCEYCWDDYLMTDRGKVEYFVGIVRGELNIDDYDADFLGHVSVCWQKYRDQVQLDADTIERLENKARELGIL